jgi:hypothetical protein
MQDTAETILKIIGAAGIAGGILAWWIGKMLADKKDDIVNQLNITHLTERVKDLEDELKELKKDFEHYKDQNR